MADYGDLPELVGRLKRAAIDAYMRTQPYPWRIDGGHYEMSSSSTHTKVTRPDAAGEGGGDWSSDNFIAELFTGGSQDDNWSAAFDAIRSRIDTAVEPFLQLPEPGAIAAEVEKCRQVSRTLAGTVDVSGAGATGAGLIAGQLDLISENSDQMLGLSIGAFKSRFVSQLGKAIAGQHVISILMGSVLESERGIWEAARQNTADIVEAARAAARDIAESGSTTDWKTVLKVSGWAVKGAGLFFPAAKPLVEGIGLGITILDGALPADQQAVINGSDAEAVLSDLEAALSKLNGQITSEEDLMHENLTVNLANIRADQSSYDLTAPPIVDDAPGDVVQLNPAAMDEITQVYMPAIHQELLSAGSTALSVSLSPSYRDARLGRGAQGLRSSWSPMRDLVYELTRDLAWEVDTGATNLNLIKLDFFGLENTTSEELGEVQDALADGSPYDPWN